jgi:hypothetical protein
MLHREYPDRKGHARFEEGKAGEKAKRYFTTKTAKIAKKERKDLTQRKRR